MIRIVTDSTCDLLQSEQAQLGVDVLPLTLNFAGHIYKDGIDLTHAQFYEKLAKSSKLTTTSQINPGEFAQYFEKCVAAGDEVVGIFLSGELSGTYQSAMIAANEVSPDRIFPVDSRCTTFAMGLLVREAVRMRDSGQYRGAEIAKAIALLAKRVRLFAVIDTLKYLKMGGRLDAKTAFVGELLGIKPVIAVTDGKVEVIGKTRGETGYGKALLKQFQLSKPDYHYGVAFGHANAPEKLKNCMTFFAPHLQPTQIYSGNVGSAIGTHTGPGVVGMAYISSLPTQL